MTKIEPVAYQLHDPEASTRYGIDKCVYFDKGELRGVPVVDLLTPLYTAAQMRQAMEACAAIADDYEIEAARCAMEIRNLIKEMLP